MSQILSIANMQLMKSMTKEIDSESQAMIVD